MAKQQQQVQQDMGALERLRESILKMTEAIINMIRRIFGYEPIDITSEQQFAGQQQPQQQSKRAGVGIGVGQAVEQQAKPTQQQQSEQPEQQVEQPEQVEQQPQSKQQAEALSREQILEEAAKKQDSEIDPEELLEQLEQAKKVEQEQALADQRRREEEERQRQEQEQQAQAQAQAQAQSSPPRQSIGATHRQGGCAPDWEPLLENGLTVLSREAQRRLEKDKNDKLGHEMIDRLKELNKDKSQNGLDKLKEYMKEVRERAEQEKQAKESNKSDVEKVLDGEMSVEDMGNGLAAEMEAQGVQIEVAAPAVALS